MSDGDGHEFDPHSGEERRRIRKTLSERASSGARRPHHWTGRVEDAPNAVIGDGGLEYEAAFYLCQEEIAPWIVAESANPFHKSRYTSLAPLLTDIRPVLAKNFMTIKQYAGKIHRAGVDGGKQYFLPVCTKLIHVPTGQSEVFVFEMPMNKMDAQEVGTLFTYGKRYSIFGIFGIASADDDAASAVLKRTLENDQVDEAMKLLLGEIEAATSKGDLRVWAKKGHDLTALPEERLVELKAAYSKKLQELPETPPKKKS